MSNHQFSTFENLNTLFTSIGNKLKNKQDKLTFDTIPTANSNNPVTSDGIKTALGNYVLSSSLGTAASKDVPTSGNASSSQVVLGNDSRLSDSRTPKSHTHTKSEITDFPTIPSINNCYQTTDTTETALADGDYVPFYDTSATAKRKTLWSNIKSILKTYFDTLYSTVKTSETAASGGTTLSLVTTGEKYTWNSKASTSVVSTTANGLAPKVTSTSAFLKGDGTWATPSNTVPTAYCSTAAGTAAKTASCTNYALLNNSHINVLITTANTAQSALTLSINSKTAKPIFINGSASSASNYTLPAGSYFVYYDGTNYYFRTDGKITGSITGDAATVNGKTVAENVPSGAKFTDTTYTFDGTYNASTNKAATVNTVTNAIGALDGAITGSAGTGKTLSAFSQTDGKVTATFSDISITKSQVSDFPSSMTPSSHTHGNIQNGGTLQTNDITIANGDKLIVTDSSDSSKVARTSIAFDGSTTSQALSKKGTWVTYLTSHQTVKQDGVTGATINRFGTCSTAAATAAKTVSITTGTFALEAGATIAVKFSNKNTADSPTLAVGSTAAKNIFVNGAQITTGGNKALLAGTVVFIYDGTQYNLIGNYYDTNTTYSKMSQSEATTGTATSARTISADVLNATITDKISGKQDKLTAKGSATKGIYVDSNGALQNMTYSVSKNVPSDALFTDTKDAANLTYSNTTSGLTATKVQNAIDEINGTVVNLLRNADNTSKDISSMLSNLPQAISERNLTKYGYKIGDFFKPTNSGTNYTYLLADLDTFYGGMNDSNAIVNTHHLGILVNTKKYQKWLNSGTLTSYVNSNLHNYLTTTVLENVKTDMLELFGGTTGLEHLLSHSKYYPSTTDSAWATNQYISAMTEAQIYGYTAWSMNAKQQGEGCRQLEIFRRVNWVLKFGNNPIWLRSIADSARACRAGVGMASADEVTDQNYVVGLILFH